MTNSLFLGVIDLKAFLKDSRFSLDFPRRIRWIQTSLFFLRLWNISFAHLSKMCFMLSWHRYAKKFAVMSNISSWLSHNSLIEKVFATSKCVCVPVRTSFIMGISSSSVSRTTLSKANERRDWRIYSDFAQSLIRTARPLYANEDLGIDLVNTIYALDASTIDLCLSVFPSLLVPLSRPLNFIPYLTYGKHSCFQSHFQRQVARCHRPLIPFTGTWAFTSWIEGIRTLPFFWPNTKRCIRAK